jgi:hypothetical protein
VEEKEEKGAKQVSAEDVENFQLIQRNLIERQRVLTRFKQMTKLFFLQYHDELFARMEESF